MLIIKPGITNISSDSCVLNISIPLLPHLTQLIERTNILSKMYDI